MTGPNTKSTRRIRSSGREFSFRYPNTDRTSTGEKISSPTLGATSRPTKFPMLERPKEKKTRFCLYPPNTFPKIEKL